MQDLMCRNGAWERSLCLKYRFGRVVGTEMVTEAVGVEEITQRDCVALKETKTRPWGPSTISGTRKGI